MKRLSLTLLGVLALDLLLDGIVFSPQRMAERHQRMEDRLRDLHRPAAEADGDDRAAKRGKLTALQPDKWRRADIDAGTGGAIVFRMGYSF